MKLVEELLQLTRYVHRAQEFILLASRRYDKVVCQHALIQMPSLSEQRIWASECNTKENRGFKKDSSLFLIFKVSFCFCMRVKARGGLQVSWLRSFVLHVF